MELLRLRSFAELVGDGLDLLRGLGRAGGLLALALAAALALGAVLLWQQADLPRPLETGHWGAELRVFAVLAAGLALASLLLGTRQLLSPRAPRSRGLAPLAPPDLLSALRFAPRPCFVCLDCRRIFGPAECAGPCPQCGSSGQCLEVLGEDDVRMVEAAVGPPAEARRDGDPRGR